MATKSDAGKLLEELTKEKGKIERRILDLERQQETAEASKLASVIMELGSLRSALPMIESRQTQAREAVKAEQDAANVAACAALRPKEKAAMDLVVQRTKELDAALVALTAVRRELRQHRGWDMALGIDDLRAAVVKALRFWRSYGNYHGEAPAKLPEPPGITEKDIPWGRRPHFSGESNRFPDPDLGPTDVYGKPLPTD